MIEFTSGDILTADVDALVNTVNCVGVMGRGIALQFKNAFPENFKAYLAACEREEVLPGRMFVFDTHALTHHRVIINFPTKRHWRGKSRMEDIDSGLIALVAEIKLRGIRSIAIPPLGSGLGGLNWADVKPRIVEALDEVPDVRVLLFEPNNAPRSFAKSNKVPDMSPGRAALVVLMQRYISGLMDPFVTLLELQKLMYFLQEAGQPLKLNYTKHLYGPYADTLRHVLRHVEGHMISGYGDGGDAPDKQLELVPGAVADAELFLADDDETIDRLKRVADLVDGFESPFGLELLATVHWVAKEGAASADEVIRGVYEWNDRKAQFSPRQILIALRVLAERSWIPPLPAGHVDRAVA